MQFALHIEICGNVWTIQKIKNICIYILKSVLYIKVKFLRKLGKVKQEAF